MQRVLVNVLYVDVVFSFLFLFRYCNTNQIYHYLQTIIHVETLYTLMCLNIGTPKKHSLSRLFSKMLVGYFGFSGPLREYFNLYWAKFSKKMSRY